MDFHQPGAELFVPDGLEPSAALARTTHLAVSAHPDDLEIMACHGILACFQRPDRWFTGVVMTSGAGSPRDGMYRGCSDARMMEIRRREQKKAAVVGEYGALALLDYPSGPLKSGRDARPVDDLATLFAAARPQVVYTHNLADKHDTHVGVALRTLSALRALPEELRPSAFYGCEVWRDLDWMVDEDKVAFDVSGHEHLQAALLGVFDSQICGGKRYDLATLGRRKAHATYHASHGMDQGTGLIFAQDLTPLLRDKALDPLDHILARIDGFRRDVQERLGRLR